jgi:glycosyltransferase involved in cell wall biosynthesis
VCFKFIGFNAKDINSNLNSKSLKNVEFIGRLPRSVLFDSLDTFSIGLVIYPDKDYFFDSFPIKVVEYASRRIPIIASNTRAHNRILGSNKALYFDLSSSESLIDCIMKIKTDKQMATLLSNNAFDWVKDLTYSNRVKKILAKTKF